MYEWGIVEKVLGNKTGITSYPWTVWHGENMLCTCFWHSEQFMCTTPRSSMFCKNKSFWQRFTCTSFLLFIYINCLQGHVGSAIASETIAPQNFQISSSYPPNFQLLIQLLKSSPFRHSFLKITIISLLADRLPTLMCFHNLWKLPIQNCYLTGWIDLGNVRPLSTVIYSHEQKHYTCYYSGNQKFCFLNSRLLTCHIFF